MRNITTSKRGRLVIAGLVALSSIAGGIVMSLPAGAAAETLKYNVHFNKAEFYDVDANANESNDAGDYNVGEFLLDKSGDTAGAFEFVCTRTAESPKKEHCIGTAKIRGRGSIAVQGNQNANAEKFVGPITGGTGEFVGAAGTLYLNFTERVGTVTFRIAE
jgi:hypothetical protein